MNKFGEAMKSLKSYFKHILINIFYLGMNSLERLESARNPRISYKFLFSF